MCVRWAAQSAGPLFAKGQVGCTFTTGLACPLAHAFYVHLHACTPQCWSWLSCVPVWALVLSVLCCQVENMVLA